MSDRKSHNEPVLPTSELRRHAFDLLQALEDEQARFVLMDRNSEHEIELNEELYDILRLVLIDLTQNKAVTIYRNDLELTSVQAAEFLQVSRPYLINLIQNKQIPCRMVGTHRRIKLEDLIEYRQRTDAEEMRDREELTKMAEDLGLGY